MPIRFPAYPKKPHATGQARIKVRGKEVYLGKHGSPESIAKYNRLIASMAAGATASSSPSEAPTQDFTIQELIDAFMTWAKSRYVKNGKPTSEIKSFRAALQPVFSLWGTKRPDAFGPKALIECRSVLVAKGFCRKRINQHVGRIRQMFKWGVAREMVSPMTLVALQSVPGLKTGEEGVADRPAVTCVPRDQVDAVKPFLTPTIWAMIQLQDLTGMRPGEVCSMRTCDVRESDPAIPPDLVGRCWAYRPATHKTEHHNKHRVIFIGPKAQAILSAWLRPDNPDAPIFSPRETVEWSRTQRRSNASSPPRLRKRKEHPKRVPAEEYDSHAYANAIAKACRKAKIPRWSPNRLRHNAGTLVRQKFGAEAAQVVLGHSNLAVTEIYAERDLQKAASAIAEVG